MTDTRITPREAVEALDNWRHFKMVTKQNENSVNRYRKIIEAYMEQEGETEFIDAETGFGVRYQQKQAAPTYDTTSMSDDMVLRLKQLGALEINHKIIEQVEGNVPGLLDLPSFKIPGKVSTALVEVKPNGDPSVGRADA